MGRGTAWCGMAWGQQGEGVGGVHLQLAGGGQDLGDRRNSHEVELEQVILVSNEGWNADLQRWVDGRGGIGGPKAAHTYSTGNHK